MWLGALCGAHAQEQKPIPQNGCHDTWECAPEKQLQRRALACCCSQHAFGSAHSVRLSFSEASVAHCLAYATAQRMTFAIQKLQTRNACLLDTIIGQCTTHKDCHRELYKS